LAAIVVGFTTWLGLKTASEWVAPIPPSDSVYLSSNGDFILYALSAPPAGPCGRFFGTSACHRRGRKSLGQT
jgi:hypothetical protein